jgi:hypothetical protein
MDLDYIICGACIGFLIFYFTGGFDDWGGFGGIQ